MGTQARARLRLTTARQPPRSPPLPTFCSQDLAASSLYHMNLASRNPPNPPTRRSPLRSGVATREGRGGGGYGMS